jgi:hypothetical protein
VAGSDARDGDNSSKISQNISLPPPSRPAGLCSTDSLIGWPPNLPVSPFSHLEENILNESARTVCKKIAKWNSNNDLPLLLTVVGYKSRK